LHPPNIIVTHPQHPRGERDYLFTKKGAQALGLNGWLGEAGVFASACVIITSPPCSNPLFYSLAHAFPVAASKMVRNIVNARCCPQDTRRADDGAALTQLSLEKHLLAAFRSVFSHHHPGEKGEATTRAALSISSPFFGCRRN
jgi:hypothetical protein